MPSSSMRADLSSTTDEIARLACSFLTNRVPETNFPLKNLDRPPQGVKLEYAASRI
jgi:hypothetical protein